MYVANMYITSRIFGSNYTYKTGGEEGGTCSKIKQNHPLLFRLDFFLQRPVGTGEREKY